MFDSFFLYSHSSIVMTTILDAFWESKPTVKFDAPLSALPLHAVEALVLPVDLDRTVQATVDKLKESLYIESTEEYRKFFLMMCRCTRGGKTTTIYATAHELRRTGINCLALSFSQWSEFKHLPQETGTQALYRAITNLIDPTINKEERRACDWDALDKYIGTAPFVLLIDAIHGLHRAHNGDLEEVLLTYFVNKSNRQLLVSSHAPIFMDSDLPVRYVGMPQSCDMTALRAMEPPLFVGLTRGTAAYYSGAPGLLYVCTTQVHDSPAGRYSTLAMRNNHQYQHQGDIAQFVHALLTGAPHESIKKYLCFCSSIVTDEYQGMQVRWAPCYVQIIIRYPYISRMNSIERSIADEMVRLYTEVQDDEFWVHLVQIAIALHLVVAKHLGGTGPFGVCEDLDMKGFEIRLCSLPEEIKTVEQARSHLEMQLQWKRREPVVLLVTPTPGSEMAIRQLDGLIAISLGTGQIDRLLGYRCIDGDGSGCVLGAAPTGLTHGCYLLHSRAPAAVRQDTPGWVQYTDKEVDTLLGASLSALN